MPGMGKVGYGRTSGYGTKMRGSKFAPGSNGRKKKKNRYSEEAMRSVYEKYSSRKKKNSSTDNKKKYGY